MLIIDTIYNELYGLYYFMIEKILEQSSLKAITVKEINNIVSKYGFYESNLYFTPNIICAEEGYNLFDKNSKGYTSIIKNKPVNYLTNLQKSFIKTILNDEKIILFLDKDMLRELENVFYDVPTLFNIKYIVFTDKALDGDHYSDETYITNFQTILNAIRNNYPMQIYFTTSKGKNKLIKIAPYKLEYGIKDDKFRLCGVSIFHETPLHYMKINLTRILHISVVNDPCTIDFKSFIAQKKKDTPIEIEVSNKRNGFERVFIGLSNYERHSAYNKSTDKCTIKIHYTDDDELELLILLLSFGPIIKVLGPQYFRHKFICRINDQLNLLKF